MAAVAMTSVMEAAARAEAATLIVVRARHQMAAAEVAVEATAAVARAVEVMEAAARAEAARAVEVREAAARAEAATAMRVAWEAAWVAVPGKLRLCHRRRRGSLARSRPCLHRHRHWAHCQRSSH